MEPDHQGDGVERLQGMVESLAVTVDKLSTNVDRTLTELSKSRDAMEENTAALKRSKKENSALRLALILSAVVIIGGSFVLWRDHVEVSCVKSWAVETGQRSQAIVQPATDRVTDLYGALGAATGGSLEGVGKLPSRSAQINYIYAAKKKYPLLVQGTKADLAKQSNAQITSTYYLIVGLDANNDFVSGANEYPVPQPPFNCSIF